MKNNLTASKASFWNRALTFIKAYEDAQDAAFDNRTETRFEGRVADLNETLSLIEARFGH